MTWLKVDDKISGHAKVLKAGNAAFGAWVRMAAWCAERGSDGVIPVEAAVLYANTEELAALLRVGLLHTHSEGYEIHDFLKYNPSRAQIASNRARWLKNSAERRGVSRDSREESRECPGSGSGSGDQRSRAETNLPDQPVRSEDPLSSAERERNAALLSLDKARQSSRPPPPTPPVEHTGVRRRIKPEAGTALPEGWEPSREQTPHSWHQDALEKGFDARHVSDIVGAFREYYTVGKGRSAKHVDWDRTWRNWLRKETPNRTAFATKTGVRPMQQPALPGEYDWSVAARAKAKVV